MKRWVLAALVLASPVMADMPDRGSYDVWFLGELHTNGNHHLVQADWVTAMAPAALVFEMLTPDQAAQAAPELRIDAEALEQALGWNASGWPDFSIYYPIFAAAPTAAIYGAAVPRDAARDAMSAGVATAFGADAAAFGLTQTLPPDQQSAREDMQLAAHCNALPPDMLPMMVDVQRMRDATLAQVALTALTETGGPVAVITGNGHARTDWGAPAALALAAPEVRQYSLGLGEPGQPPLGTFSQVIEVPKDPNADTADPCEAFTSRTGN
ncbi:ChaN family lipoprotein [Pseudoprimorskyibacter insulae]|uniref:Haem-binding uptake Tiki superfamily ChaN domain-containing protein n=1 Tax=Pseudoprimorskyibacter insulae TaxID=1695997 RepID=A0A2R8AP24_9RHOB|nr:ChaN family lipoprotein [Pseudoprimorskyibacter insulae]SPF77614.1 hypothetical protein PRI8871_00198 [Pseudoprimorskyibacter insulae]